MHRFVLILNFPPFIGAEPLLPILGADLDADWIYIDPLSQLLEGADELPPEIAWGLGDAISAAQGAGGKGRNLILGWRAPERVFRRFEQALAAESLRLFAVTFAPPMDEALTMAAAHDYPDAAKQEVACFYRLGCHRLSRGVLWEGIVFDPQRAALILGSWLRRRLGIPSMNRNPVQR